MSLSFSFKQCKNFSNLPSQQEGTALVLGFQSKQSKAFFHSSLNVKKAYTPFLELVEEQDSFRGAHKSTLFFRSHPSLGTIKECYKHALAFGIGDESGFYPRQFLQWGGKLYRSLKSYSLSHVDVNLDSFFHPPSSVGAKNAPKDFAKRKLLKRLPDRGEMLEKMVLGILLASYEYDRHKTLEKKNETRELSIRFYSHKMTDAQAKKALNQARFLAESINFTRDLQNAPGNHMTPEKLHKEIAQEARKTGFKVKAFDEKKLKSLGMGGILTVGKGSSNPPRMIIMEHNADKKKLPTVVVVGKGVTFDTGGISLKPAGGMEEMKMDMSGAAATAGIVRAASLLKLPIRLIGLIPSAENKPGADSVNPGDVYTSYSGKTVEVLNTDAEGRLVLADALSYAAELKPDCVFNIATLTGAICVALGTPATGLMGNNAGFMDFYKEQARAAGEEAWEMPLYEQYHKDVVGKVSDLKNMGKNREGGAQIAGAFLNHFVEDQYPWVHLDVAATAMSALPGDTHQKAGLGTGIPVGSVVEFLKNFKKNVLS